MGKLNSINKYSFLILSAGINKRFIMKNFDQPKSLLKIKKSSLIEKILKDLKNLGVKKINIVVGYKHQLIQNHIFKLKIKPKVNFIKIKDYRKYGSGYSIFKFKNEWSKNKKPLIMMHSDIYCDLDYFKDVINSKFKNTIGITNFNDKKLKKSFLGVECLKKKIKEINFYHKLTNYFGQISCINKFSSKTTAEIFKFMEHYFISDKNKKKTWELVINDLIHSKTKSKFFVNKKNYKSWHNVNKLNDYLNLKKVS